MLLKSFYAMAAAVAFYTRLPIPPTWNLKFERVARLAPLVGIGIGAGVGLLDWGMASGGVPVFTRSAIAVCVWLNLTGGLHLDGAMDTADGLAVPDPDRRLQVMADSVTGAFGAMAAIAIVLLKTAILTDLSQDRWLALVAAAGWGRWAQQVAIYRYPYLKPTGKGAFHKAALTSVWHLVPSLLMLLGITAVPLIGNPLDSDRWVIGAIGSLGLAVIIPAWFHGRLGGHTGDTYGAVVEWTEVAILLWMLLWVPFPAGAIATGTQA